MIRVILTMGLVSLILFVLVVGVIWQYYADGICRANGFPDASINLLPTPHTYCISTQFGSPVIRPIEDFLR